MPPDKLIPLDVRHLFKTLDEKLIALLESLSEEDWNRQTVAVKWRVKDVVSHLLDGNIRALSMQRDGYIGEKPVGLHDFQELVNWLNRLNSDWVKATHRISPKVLIYLHQVTGPQVSDYYASLNPREQAIFAVDWAGEETSFNWMHLAREYSEKWHHQQQIRDATGREGIMNQEFFNPAISAFFFALPHTFKRVAVPDGTIVHVNITGPGGGDWYLARVSEHWKLIRESTTESTSSVSIPAEISWKLFSKSIRPNEILSEIEINGDQELGKKVLDMVSVMA